MTPCPLLAIGNFELSLWATPNAMSSRCSARCCEIICDSLWVIPPELFKIFNNTGPTLSCQERAELNRMLDCFISAAISAWYITCTWWQIHMLYQFIWCHFTFLRTPNNQDIVSTDSRYVSIAVRMSQQMTRSLDDKHSNDKRWVDQWQTMAALFLVSLNIQRTGTNGAPNDKSMTTGAAIRNIGERRI